MNQNKIKNKRFENYEDSLWKVIMHKYSEEEGKELTDEIAALKDDPHYQPTDAEKIKYYKMLDGELRKQKWLSIGKTSKKILTRAAVVILVFILGFSILFTTVDAFRVQVLNFLLTFDKEYTTVKLGEDENDRNIIAGFNNIYMPTYIPDDYCINEIVKNEALQIIEYLNEDNKYIKFYAYEPFMATNLDTENAEIIKSIKINGLDGIFILKKEIATVSWSNDEKLFVIHTLLNEEEIIKIAESVTYIE